MSNGVNRVGVLYDKKPIYAFSGLRYIYLYIALYSIYKIYEPIYPIPALPRLPFPIYLYMIKIEGGYFIIAPSAPNAKKPPVVVAYHGGNLARKRAV